MTSDQKGSGGQRWQQIEQLYHAALERDSGQRAAFLAEACAGDEALRQEVASLLAHEPASDGFLSAPALDVAASMPVADAPPTMAGRQIGGGHYRLGEQIGEGGMGVVYRAVDEHLKRAVAIKFLPSELEHDPERVRRFTTEARAASALNHPHILTVHEAGEFEGRPYLVTELIDGGTLKEWARSAPRTWRQVVELLIGVADGLAAAHQAGILHRDIKPENILVARNGYAKLADFGLATLQEDATSQGLTRSMTAHTRPGTMLGTVAYMSPEQASGRSLDARSDIFSFGVVLYELLARRRPFAGDSDLEVMHAIVHRAPEPLGSDMPRALRDVTEKALEKDPAERYQSARDLVVDLRRVTRQTEELAATRPRTRLWIAAVATVAVALSAVALWRLLSRASAAPISSIAVLPLQNLSGDPSQEYFSDGTTEELIATLAQIHSLKVISRTSMMRYKGTHKSLPEIGRELGVDAIIEGSVRRSGGRVRITAQLIRVSTDAHLWARDFDQDAADVLTLQGDVAQAIAREIRAQVTPEETGRLARTRRINPAAREQYLLGRYHWWLMNPSDYRRAIAYFNRAIELQPDYAAAYAGLSLSWHVLEFTGTKLSEAEAPARLAAQRALALDPDLPEAHVAMAGVLWTGQWDWAGADQEYRRALALNPESLEACGCYTQFLLFTGRVADSLAISEQSVAIDPLSSMAHRQYGVALFMAGKYGDSLPHMQRSIELNGRDLSGYRRLAELDERMGNLLNALAALDRPEFRPSADLGRMYALLGRRAEALTMVKSLTTRGSDPYRIGALYVALGDRDRGFEWLTRAFDERQPVVSFVKFDPKFDAVRSDPRFRDLVARLKLP